MTDENATTDEATNGAATTDDATSGAATTDDATSGAATTDDATSGAVTTDEANGVPRTDGGTTVSDETETAVHEAQAAALELANADESTRNDALHAIADRIDAEREAILDANERDVAAAEEKLAAGEYTQAFVGRLAVDDAKIDSIVEMVRSVADQADPLGETLAARQLDDDLELYRVAVPIGVIGTVFESRPDALVQIAALAAKSGNAVILKGGSEATHSNRALYDCIVEATNDVLPDGWVQQIEAHEAVDTVLAMDDAIDLLMPRGSSDFVGYVQDNTQIPVLGHTEGICHVYVDREADLDEAEEVALDAKMQYPAVCNAVETLLVHEAVAGEFLPGMAQRYDEAGVELRVDERADEILAEWAPDVETVDATEADYHTEYGDLVLAIRVVDSLVDAVNHVTTYGSKHTESILTEDADRAEQFMTGVDSASVFHNASTRFADGYRYGLGAEVGISTGKVHARGPVGLDGLTTYKYYLEGDGHRVATYAGEDARPFTHRDIDAEWSPGRRSNE